MTPLTEPSGTYYAALNWNGGYAGLQRDGLTYKDQLQFSVWDAEGRRPELVEAANGLHCHGFTHEEAGSSAKQSTRGRWGTPTGSRSRKRSSGDAVFSHCA